MLTWSSSEVAALVRAVSRAPSVHHTQPWTVEVRTEFADLHEQPVALPRHDPEGRDRVLSCGAALTNLELAVRVLGQDTATTVLPTPAEPTLLARVHARGGRTATSAEAAEYAAIFRRRSHREPFALRPVRAGVLRALTDVAVLPEARVRVVDPATESRAVAGLLGYAASVYHDDPAYQRELAAWSHGFPQPPTVDSTLPWAGLVRRETRLPDELTLADRLARERLLIVHTPGDSRRDHLLAGAAMQHLWLTAVGKGLVASVLTQPLHLDEVRTGLAERLALGGFPQLILRVGWPARADEYRTPVAARARRDRSRSSR
ncbi:nitroreductase family protein [Amycolatopsis aidingensis]|uniref:hypothetical protein n=1 Tax=Amycolatopsis aidingensis TaxID=2842453 RepID=UPI001C0E5684|nr:hypothetical protein [Amycolatopsis aidingensis]